MNRIELVPRSDLSKICEKALGPVYINSAETVVSCFWILEFPSIVWVVYVHTHTLVIS